MQKKWAAVGTSAFFAVAPGIVAGAVPWRLTGWKAADQRPAGCPSGWPGPCSSPGARSY
jgi:hypothetical protein